MEELHYFLLLLLMILKYDFFFFFSKKRQVQKKFFSLSLKATIAEYEAGEKDVLRHAVNFFINLKGLFVHILSILTRNND